MSTSDRIKVAKSSNKIYLVLSIFWLVFSIIYKHFSHGVNSPFMQFCFLFPLLGGFFPSLLIEKSKIPYPSVSTQRLYFCGIITLNIGSCMRGIFDISGVSTNLIPFYWIVGLPLTGVAITRYLTEHILSRFTRSR